MSKGKRLISNKSFKSLNNTQAKKFNLSNQEKNWQILRGYSKAYQWKNVIIIVNEKSFFLLKVERVSSAKELDYDSLFRLTILNVIKAT